MSPTWQATLSLPLLSPRHRFPDKQQEKQDQGETSWTFTESGSQSGARAPSGCSPAQGTSISPTVSEDFWQTDQSLSVPMPSAQVSSEGWCAWGVTCITSAGSGLCLQVKERERRNPDGLNYLILPLAHERPQVWGENRKLNRAVPRGRSTHRPCLAVFPLRIDLHSNCRDHTNHFRGRHRVLRDPLGVLKVAVLQGKNTVIAKGVSYGGQYSPS